MGHYGERESESGLLTAVSYSKPVKWKSKWFSHMWREVILPVPTCETASQMIERLKEETPSMSCFYCGMNSSHQRRDVTVAVIVDHSACGYAVDLKYRDTPYYQTHPFTPLKTQLNKNWPHGPSSFHPPHPFSPLSSGTRSNKTVRSAPHSGKGKEIYIFPLVLSLTLSDTQSEPFAGNHKHFGWTYIDDEKYEMGKI